MNCLKFKLKVLSFLIFITAGLFIAIFIFQAIPLPSDMFILFLFVFIGIFLTLVISYLSLYESPPIVPVPVLQRRNNIIPHVRAPERPQSGEILPLYSINLDNQEVRLDANIHDAEIIDTVHVIDNSVLIQNRNIPIDSLEFIQPPPQVYMSSLLESALPQPPLYKEFENIPLHV